MPLKNILQVSFARKDIFFSSIGDHGYKNRPEFEKFIRRVEKSSDEFRASSTEKRHSKKYRTARENLFHLVDEDSFLEFGQFAVAAQRSRRDYEELQDKTNARRHYYWFLLCQFRISWIRKFSSCCNYL